MATYKKHVFTQLEKKCFIAILKNYAAVIENKNTDGATSRAKKEAWENVAREYNASPHVTFQATSSQLKRLWMNIKQRQREALTRERQHRLATGGGPSTSHATIDPDVATIAPALIAGVEDAIDSDTFLVSSGIQDFNYTESDPLPPSEPLFNISPPLPSIGNLSPSPPTISPLPSPRRPSFPSTSPPPNRNPRRSLFPSTSPPPNRNPRRSLFPSTSPPPNPNPRRPLFPSPPPPPPNPRRARPPAASPPPPPPPLPTVPIPYQRQKNTIITKEYEDRKRRAEEIHCQTRREAKAKADLAELMLQQQELEINLLQERIREAKAKADLAAMVLQQRGRDYEAPS